MNVLTPHHWWHTQLYSDCERSRTLWAFRSNSSSSGGSELQHHGPISEKIHSAWRKTHILALFTPGNRTIQLEVKLPRHGSDDNAPPGLW